MYRVLVPVYEELNIELPDGYRAYARYYAPARCRAAVLYLHGIQSHAGWYEASAERLQEAGMAVLVPDRRGSGRNRQSRGHADSCDQLLADTRVCMDQLLSRTGVAKCAVVGISWGGKLAAAMHVKHSGAISALALVAPGIFPKIDVSSLDKFRIGVAMISNREKAFPIPLNNPELFTGNPERIEFLRHDALQLHEATAAFFLASRRMDKVARRLGKAIPVPVHVFLAGDERIIESEQTKDFVRQLGWRDTTITQYTGARHTLEFEASSDEYLNDLTAWLGDRCITERVV